MSKGNKWGATLDAAVYLGAPKVPIAGIESLRIEDGFVRRLVVCCPLNSKLAQDMIQVAGGTTHG